MKFLSAVFTACFIFVSIAHAETIAGKIVAVSDGDTVTLLTSENQRIKIRLVEIDAPEKGQPYGQESKKALSNLVFDKTVSVESSKQDKYGRSLGRIYIGDVDVNLEQVRTGAAWAYTQYLTDDNIRQAEIKARNAKLGLWSLQADQIVPPWEWRHGGKNRSAAE